MYDRPFNEAGSRLGFDVNTPKGLQAHNAIVRVREGYLYRRARGLGWFTTFDLLRYFRDRMGWELKSRPHVHAKSVAASTWSEAIEVLDDFLVRADDLSRKSGASAAKALRRLEEKEVHTSEVVKRMCASFINAPDDQLNMIDREGLRLYARELLNRKDGRRGEVDSEASYELVKFKRDQAKVAGDLITARAMGAVLGNGLAGNIFAPPNAPRINIKRARAQRRLVEFEEATRGLSGDAYHRAVDVFAAEHGESRHDLLTKINRAQKARARR